MGQYTAVIRQNGKFRIGWIVEISGVNSQGETREELLENLQSGLEEMLELNRELAYSGMENSSYETVCPNK